MQSYGNIWWPKTERTRKRRSLVLWCIDYSPLHPHLCLSRLYISTANLKRLEESKEVVTPPSLQRSSPSLLLSFHILFTVSLTLIPPNNHSLPCLPQCAVVPEVFLVFFSVFGRDGLVGQVEIGERTGSEPGLKGSSEEDVDSVGFVLMAVGGDFRGDFGLERKMLSVVVARVIDRAWKGSGIEKDFEDRPSGKALIGVGEKAEGDIGGLTLAGTGPYGEDVETTGVDWDRSSAATDFDIIVDI